MTDPTPPRADDHQERESRESDLHWLRLALDHASKTWDPAGSLHHHQARVLREFGFRRAPEPVREDWSGASEVVRAARGVWRNRDQDDGGKALIRAIGYLGAVLTAYDQRNRASAQPEPVREAPADMLREFTHHVVNLLLRHHTTWPARCADEITLWVKRMLEAQPESVREAWIAARHVVFAARAVVHAWEGDGDPNPLDDAMDKLRDIVTAYDQRNHDRAQSEPQQQGGEDYDRGFRDGLAEAFRIVDAEWYDQHSTQRHDGEKLCADLMERLRKRFAAPAPAAPAGDAVREALTLAKQALQHDKRDCWATGPNTGDPIADLVVCPGCQAIAAIDRALASKAAPAGVTEAMVEAAGVAYLGLRVWRGNDDFDRVRMRAALAAALAAAGK